MTVSRYKLSAFVLTFDGSIALRGESANSQMRALGSVLDWHLVKGFSPRDMELANHYDDKLNRKHSKRPLGAGEIAVYAGHRKMMRQFLESGQPYALFLEDDFAWLDTPSRWQHLITHTDGVMNGRDLLKLFDFGPPRTGFVDRVTHGPIEMIKPLSIGAGTVGYVMSREGARKILSRKKIFRQIDEDIKYFWELDLDIWAVMPQMICEISDVLGGSFIGAERSEIKQRHRNIATSMKGNYLALRKMVLNRLHRANATLRNSS